MKSNQKIVPGVLGSISVSGAVVCAIVLGAALLFSYRLEGVQGSTASGIELAAFPRVLGYWRGEDSTKLDARSADILKLDEYIRRLYTAPDGRSVFVYVGYWKRQSGEHQAGKHSPLMCFPANGLTITPPESTEIASSRSTPAGGSEWIHARKIRASDKNNSSFYFYWFFSGKETYRDETFGLLYVLRETIFQGRSDGGIVELSVDLPSRDPTAEQIAEAEKTLREFSAEFVPALEHSLDGGGKNDRSEADRTK